MRLVSLLLLGPLLISCGGGSSETSTIPSTPTPIVDPPIQSPVSNDIEGRWFYIYPNSQCVEVFSFAPNNTFEISSNTVVISGQYQFEKTVEQGTRHKLDFDFAAQNRFGPDCENQSANVVNTSLTLYATFSDNFDMLLYESLGSTEVIYQLKLDNPIVLQDFPDRINLGQALRFSVSGERALIAPTINELIPAGMQTTETGELVWQVDIPVFKAQSSLTMRFSSVESIDDLIHTFEVNAENVSLPAVRTNSLVINGDRTGSFERLLLSGNFDTQAGQEIIIYDGSITALSIDEDNLTWKWTFPYGLPTPSGAFNTTPTLRKFDTQNDGIDNVFFSSDRSIYTFDSLDLEPRLVFRTNELLLNFEVADINNDGQADIIVLLRSGIGEVIEVWDGTNNQLRFSVNIEELVGNSYDDVATLSVGNVDGDSQLEIVLSNGFVIDILTGDVQWYLGSGFGEKAIIEDIDLDGVMEVIGYADTNILQVWDADLQSTVAQGIERVYSPCTIAANKGSETIRPTIVVYDCDSDRRLTFMLNNDLIEPVRGIEEELSLREFNVNYIHLLDINDDGQNEVLLNSRTEQAGLLVLTVAEKSISKTRQYTPLRDFTKVGFGEITSGDFAGVFFASSQEPFNYALVKLSNDGQLKIGEFKTQSPQSLVTTLYDLGADGFGDALIMGEQTQGPNLQISSIEIASDTLSNVLELQSNRLDQYAQLQLFDIDKDDEIDILIANNNKLELTGLQSGRVLASLALENEPFIREPYDFAVRETAQGEVIIAGSSAVGISLYKYSDESLQTLATSSIKCQQILFLGESGNIFCMGSQGTRYFFKVLNKQDLTELSSFSSSTVEGLGDYVAAVAIEGSDNIYASGQFFSDTQSDYFSIVELHPYTGEIVWRSPSLLGLPQKGDIELIEATNTPHKRLFFTTEVAVYLTQ
jgi:hypothetical protein